MKILYTNDEAYAVEYNNSYYLVNLNIDEKPMKYKYLDSILKFGYFEEVENISKDIFDKIASILEKEVE